FFNHIKVAPQNDQFLLTYNQKDLDWIISTATVVDGFLRLISTNPKRDADSLRKLDEKSRKRSVLIKDTSPLRDFYLENNDLLINKFSDIDFSDNFFTASGIGKSRIQNIILIRLDYKKLDDIRKEEEKPDYTRLSASPS